MAQLILERIVTADVVQVERLPTTSRGSSCFGRTGLVYLSMYSIIDECEPISEPGAVHLRSGGSEGVGSGNTSAASEVPPQ